MKLLLILALQGCTDKGASEFDRSLMLAATVEGVILPSHEELLTGAQTLVTHVNALCSAPDALDLAAARDSWSQVSTELSRMQVWGFGPAREDTIELTKNLDKWPANAEAIEAIVAGSDTLDAAYIAGLDYTERVVGYPAIEYLLWSDPTTDEIIARFENPRRCQLLIGLAEHAAGFVADYHAAWSPDAGDYASELSLAGQGSSTFSSEQAAVTELVSGVLTATTFLSGMRLGVPLGDSNGGTALPDQVEAPFAVASLERIEATMAGIRALYVVDGEHGLADYVRSRQAAGDVDAAVTGALDAADSAIGAIPGPLEDAVSSAPEAVRAAINAVDGVTVVFAGDVSTLLGVNPTAVEADND